MATRDDRPGDAPSRADLAREEADWLGATTAETAPRRDPGAQAGTEGRPVEAQQEHGDEPVGNGYRAQNWSLDTPPGPENNPSRPGPPA